MTEHDCIRCGRCCRLFDEDERGLFYIAGHCRHLDPVSKLCTVYDKRLSVKRCSPVSVAIAAGLHPQGCPYTGKGYKCRIEERGE